MKRLMWDVEVSPCVALLWKVGFKLNVNYDSIIKERAIICIGYKWEGQAKKTVLTWDENQCDKAMLKAFIEVAKEADEMVAYFGDSFDAPWVRTRSLFHGLNFPPVKTVDPLQWARRKFLLQSNKLDYVSKFLGMKGKTDTKYALWKDITLKNCQKSLRKMALYCANDLVLLEEVWRRLSMCVSVKTHAGVLAGGEKWSCPRCESEKVRINKTKVTAAGTRQTQLQCTKCGGYHTVNDKTRRDYETEMKRRKK